MSIAEASNSDGRGKVAKKVRATSRSSIGGFAGPLGRASVEKQCTESRDSCVRNAVSSINRAYAASGTELQLKANVKRLFSSIAALPDRRNGEQPPAPVLPCSARSESLASFQRCTLFRAIHRTAPTEELLGLDDIGDGCQHHAFPGRIAALNARQNLRCANRQIAVFESADRLDAADLAQ